MLDILAPLVLVVVVLIGAFIFIRGCHRELRHVVLTNNEALYIAQASRNLQNMDERRAVRVTTISRDGDHVALGVYEIRMPNNRGQNRSALESAYCQRRQPSPAPPSFSTALQVSSPITYVDMDEPPPSYEDYLKLQPPNDNDIRVHPPEDDKSRF